MIWHLVICIMRFFECSQHLMFLTSCSLVWSVQYYVVALLISWSLNFCSIDNASRFRCLYFFYSPGLCLTCWLPCESIVAIEMMQLICWWAICTLLFICIIETVLCWYSGVHGNAEVKLALRESCSISCKTNGVRRERGGLRCLFGRSQRSLHILGWISVTEAEFLVCYCRTCWTIGPKATLLFTCGLDQSWESMGMLVSIPLIWTQLRCFNLANCMKSYFRLQLEPSMSAW
jgi:hypothetical protein